MPARKPDPEVEALRRRLEILEASFLLLSRTVPGPQPYPSLAPNASVIQGTSPEYHPPPGWIPLVHSYGDYPCHKTAWYLTRKFWRGEKGDLTAIRRVDGSVPEVGDAPLCGNCQRPVHPYTSQDLDFSPALVNSPTELDQIIDQHSSIPADDFSPEGFS